MSSDAVSLLEKFFSLVTLQEQQSGLRARKKEIESDDGFQKLLEPLSSSAIKISKAPLPKQVSTIFDVTPDIRQHRRLYESDLNHLKTISPELLTNLTHNRIMVTLPREATSSIRVREWVHQYEEWLDDNIHGFYTIDESSDRTGFVLSFEIEAELVQFSLAFR